MLNFKETASELVTIDGKIALGERDIPPLFRNIPLDAFGKLLLDVPATYPNIRAYFPKMASDEVQKKWTGASGESLLRQSIAFVRSCLSAYHQFCPHPLSRARVLDFGCGYGRIIRLMYKYCSEDNIYAVDPWDKSMELCRENGVKGHLALSNWMPTSLPFDGPFDLVYAFSVFTHLSEKTAKVALNTLRTVISESGLLIITIRPPEYWDFHEGGKLAADMKPLHASRGFAFKPHNRAPVDGEVTYGDASISLEYIRRAYPDWRIVGVDWNACDAYQILVFMQPSKN